MATTVTVTSRRRIRNYFETTGEPVYAYANSGSSTPSGVDGYTKTEADALFLTETEADARFVNVAGDTMTGALTVATGSSLFNNIPGSGDYKIDLNGITAPWTRGLHAEDAGISLMQFGFLGNTGSITNAFVGKSYTDVCAKFFPDAGTLLYYNNALKFETTTTGVDVTGELDVSGHISTAAFYTAGYSIFTDPNIGSNSGTIQLGHNRTVDGNAYIDLVGDTTYSDYGLRIIRQSGVNSQSQLIHRGTGSFVFQTIDGAGFAFLDGNVGIGTTAPGAKLDINGNVIVGTDIGSAVYSSGFAGSGWQYDNSEDRLTIDNLTVRKQLRVYELLIEQIRANRGAIVVSPGNAKILSNVTGTVTIDAGDDNRFPMSLVANDIIRCQRWSGVGIKYYIASVDSVTGDTFTYTILDGTDDIEAGDEVVVVGNSTNTARQGLIYITSSDDNAPYIDILDGVTDGDFSGHQKVRLGKLDGITDADVGGALTGYGLYSENVYLKGTIVANAGEIGGFTINATDGLYAGSGTTRVQMKPGAGFWAGATAIGDAPFSVTQAGSLKAEDGSIGGWSIDSDAIFTGTKKTADGYSTDGITLASNSSLHAENFYIDADGSVAFRSSGSGARVQFYDNYMQMYNSSGTLLYQVEASTDGGKLGTMDAGTAVYMRGSYLTNTAIETYISPVGIKNYYGSTAGSTAANIISWDSNHNIDIGDGFYYSTPNINIDGLVKIDAPISGTHASYTGCALNVNTNHADDFAAHFFNDGNNNNRYGIKIQAGKDSPGATDVTEFIGLYDGNGTELGVLYYFEGSIGITNWSDSRLKEDIEVWEVDALTSLNLTKPKKYRFKASSKKEEKYLGYVAQDVENVIKGMVIKRKEDSYMSIDKVALIPYLHKAILELQEQLNTLQEQV